MKVKDGRKVGYWNTLDPAVLGQPAGDSPADPDGEATTRDETFEDIARAEGLGQLSQQGKQSLIFGPDMTGDLRHIAKGRNVVDDEGMGLRDGVQCHLVIELVG